MHDAVPTKQRAFTKPELQHPFEVVDEQHRKRVQRWLIALRAAIAFKIGYACGLQCQELVMLDRSDFGPNPHVPSYQDYRVQACLV